MSENFDLGDLKKLYKPAPDSHKGMNGKLMVIGGSSLFHAASLWALNIASRIVDMVFYSSVPENNMIVAEVKREFRNGIVVLRDDVESYIKEADCVLIGPGMVRMESGEVGRELEVRSLGEINKLKSEGEQTYFLTKYLLEKYPQKKWVIDAGALQMMEPEWLGQLKTQAVLTPHVGELEMITAHIKNKKTDVGGDKSDLEKRAVRLARDFNCIVLLKGREDFVCSADKQVRIEGGNAGMTKGGTGDVLAGLVAALACKNDLWLSAVCASYFNKKAGDRLFEKVGYYFNSSDLVDEIPRVMAGV